MLNDVRFPRMYRERNWRRSTPVAVQAVFVRVWAIEDWLPQLERWICRQSIKDMSSGDYNAVVVL